MAVDMLASCLQHEPECQPAGMSSCGYAQPVIGLRNVLEGPLEACCTSPITGYFRDVSAWDVGGSERKAGVGRSAEVIQTEWWDVGNNMWMEACSMYVELLGYVQWLRRL